MGKGTGAIEVTDKAMVILSGGQDSTTCLYWAIDTWGLSAVRAVFFNYGQRHVVELGSAHKVAELSGVPLEVVNLLDDVLVSSSPLTNKSEEVERYESVEALPGGLEKTYVPGRNALFLTLAANRAAAHGIQNLVIGVSQEDFGGYPDCRRPFIEAMELALTEGFPRPFKVYTPLLTLDKAETVRMASELLGCLEALAWTHTCYNGNVPPCGKCHSCHLRAHGFERAGIPDPLMVRLTM
jgi:7-cyano-7-deazaguanine synthase